MRVFANCLFVIILLSVSCNVYGQLIVINESNNVTSLPGEELFAEWSYDGKSLLFESIVDDTSSIYIYQLTYDTLFKLSNLNYNLKNPTWHPDGNKVVFDSDKAGYDYLYTFDVVTMEVSPLFNRRIKCKNASFSTTSRQVYFSGFDELQDCWEIYSYDFIYDNLNKLTDNCLVASCPDIYNNGKQLVYCSKDNANDSSLMVVINWYGEQMSLFNKFNAYYPSWGPAGFKIFFVSTMDDEDGELYSIWKDGSHLERLTHDNIKVAHPVISPDGTKLAMSALTENGWDIFIFDIIDY